VQRLTFEFSNDDFEYIENFIKERFLELKKYEDIPDDELPICTDEERWREPTKYAVKKKVNKTATKLHETLEDAENHLKNLEDKFPNIYEIEVREGTDKKCLEYCSCCQFCSYYKEHYMKGEEDNVQVSEM